MKNFCISLICLSIIILAVALVPHGGAKEEYLRIHVRANSNSADDQEVKYRIKDEIVEYLTPIVVECKSKKALQNTLYRHKTDIEAVANGVLVAEGFGYKSNVQLKAEEFPTRIYDGVTLDAGVYDAIIVNLGTGEGDNWWCVVYPPLCFIGEEGVGIEYRSKILQIINEWRERCGK